MTSTTTLILLIVGAFLSTFAATAAQVLHEFARHELEEYCIRHNRRHWFDTIIRGRDRFALGAEALQMIGISFVAVSGLTLVLGKLPLEAVTAWAWSGWIASLIIVLLLCNSWIPWGVVHFAAAPFLFHTWRFWWVVSLVSWPLTIGVQMASAVMSRISGDPHTEEDAEEEFEDEIRSMASEGERGGWLETRVRDMLEGVLDLDDTVVAKVMTPRSRVDAIEVSTDWDTMLKYVVETERTRLPVFRQRADNVLGILYTKDLLTEFHKPIDKRRPLERLLRRPLFVPESTRLDEMLSRFLQNRVHLAVVMDEYNAVSGIITIEDILEEIVGEIQDETDVAEPAVIERLSKNEARVAGTAHIEQLNQELGLQLPETDDYDTVAGLLMSKLNEIPRRGQIIAVGNVEFEVQQATPRVVEILKLKINDEPTV